MLRLPLRLHHRLAPQAGEALSFTALEGESVSEKSESEPLWFITPWFTTIVPMLPVAISMHTGCNNSVKSEFYCGLESKHSIYPWVALELQIPKLVSKVSELQ